METRLSDLLKTANLPIADNNFKTGIVTVGSNLYVGQNGTLQVRLGNSLTVNSADNTLNVQSSFVQSLINSSKLTVEQNLTSNSSTSVPSIAAVYAAILASAASPLTGYAIAATNRAVAATDSIATGIGLVEKQAADALAKASTFYGTNNTMYTPQWAYAIGGGYNSVVGTGVYYSSVIAGASNVIGGTARSAVILGGENNSIATTGQNSTIVGAYNCKITAGFGSFIAASQGITVGNAYTVVLALNQNGTTVPASAANSVVSKGFTCFRSVFTANGTYGAAEFATIQVNQYGSLTNNGAHLAIRWRGAYAAGVYSAGDMVTYNGFLYTVPTSFNSTSATPPNGSLTRVSELSTLVPQAVKDAVQADTVTWTSGEFQGTQPTGSVPGMKFCGANYRYEFMNGMSDTDGTSFVWVRLLKANS